MGSRASLNITAKNKTLQEPVTWHVLRQCIGWFPGLFHDLVDIHIPTT